MIEIKPPPPPKWAWAPFGDFYFTVMLPHEVSWIARLTTKLFLGSKWRKYQP